MDAQNPLFLNSPEQQKAAIPVPEPQVPVEQTLARSLTPRLDEHEEEVLADRITSDYWAAKQDRWDWEQRLAEWEDMYFCRVAEKQFPWAGCSNFCPPIVPMGMEAFKPRLVDGVLGQDPPILVTATKAADEDRREKVETVLNWQVRSEIENLEQKLNESAHLFLNPGLSIVKSYWKVTRNRRKYVRSFPAGTPIPSIIEVLFGPVKPREVESIGDKRWRGYIPAPSYAGEDLEVIIEMAILDNEIQVLVDRDEIDERPAVENIDPIDFLTPVKGGHQIEDLPWCQHRMWLTNDDLRRKVALGRFYQDAVQELLDQREGQPEGDRPQDDSTLYREGMDMAEGVEGQGPSNARQYQYEILEDYRRYDIDGDGFDEEIITWVCPDLYGKILGWDYLDNVYAHGMRPFDVERYYPIPFRWFGISFPELVKPLFDEIKTIHDQRVDYATIQNVPFFFYRASATLPPIVQALRPGEGIPTDDPQKDINIPRWQGSPAWGQQEEATLMQMYERLTGVTDLSIGRQPNRVGATRTASGTQTLLSESGLRFKTALSAFQRLWIGVFSKILALDQEYLPPGKEFRVTGKRPAVVRVKDRTEIRGKYDLRLAATSETMNRQQMRQDATTIMQAVLNPAFMQTGMISLKGIRQCLTDFLKSYGKDPESYVEAQSVIRSPQQELQMFVTGQYVGPVMGENLDGHLQAHQEALMDPIVSPEAKQLIQRHIQETLQMKQMTQVMQALTAGKGGPGGPNVQGPQAPNAQEGRQAPQPNAGVPQEPSGKQQGGQPGGGSAGGY